MERLLARATSTIGNISVSDAFKSIIVEDKTNRSTAQCVWHNTTHLGMGKAKSKSGHTYIVGRYAPKGNVPGERPYQP